MSNETNSPGSLIRHTGGMTLRADLNTRIANAVRDAQADGTYECTVPTYPTDNFNAIQWPDIATTDRKVTIHMGPFGPATGNPGPSHWVS